MAATSWSRGAETSGTDGKDVLVSVVGQYCVSCHSAAVMTADLDLASITSGDIVSHAETWERVVRKLDRRQMPPAGLPRPDEVVYESAIAGITAELDRHAQDDPSPGRTATFRRLTRTEYRNAVRDVLAVDVDADLLLPNDEASHGFDNVTVGDLPPMLLERYVSAAEKISRTAVGRPGKLPDAYTVRVPPDVTQESHLPGLPIGTRGGVSVRYTFPVDGEYEISVRLARDRNEDIEGLTRPHQMEILVERERVALLDVKPPPKGDDHRLADSHLKVRTSIRAGPRQVAATFIKDASVLLETQRQPYQARFNFYRHPRMQPAVFSVSIVGPLSTDRPGHSPSRQRILTCAPNGGPADDECAKSILRPLVTKAFRRPASEADLEGPMEFYRQGWQDAASDDEAFDAGIERALAAILVSPNFLFRIERDPLGVAPGTAYHVSDLDLASRLSFFLWSSLPDSELLDAATAGELGAVAGLEGQIRRMLADERAMSLVDNFASQWLHLRNLASVRPNMRLFPDFDDNLRQAFRRETELLIENVMREDRSVLDLLRSDYTFVNERLARHYDIPNVYGSRFRRIELSNDSVRGGLLRHGSILTVTSYATRTSPVIRGKWILENILGMPPPPPPADVPDLVNATISGKLSVRERLAQHRADPACSGCHNPMDPLGFALENFDAVGRWREKDGGEPIDTSGRLVDGTHVADVDGLEDALLSRPELFVGLLAEKLLTFALGRGVEHFDAPAIRKIVRNAEADGYRFSSLLLGIANSTPFRMRRSQ